MERNETESIRSIDRSIHPSIYLYSGCVCVYIYIVGICISVYLYIYIVGVYIYIHTNSCDCPNDLHPPNSFDILGGQLLKYRKIPAGKQQETPATIQLHHPRSSYLPK